MAEPDAIDRAAFDELLETTGGDEGFLAEMIDAFAEDTTELIASLQAAVASGDLETLRRAAHTLKSNSATFGAHILADQCRELEERARSGALDDAATRVAAIVQEAARVDAALSALRPDV